MVTIFRFDHMIGENQQLEEEEDIQWSNLNSNYLSVISLFVSIVFNELTSKA